MKLEPWSFAAHSPKDPSWFCPGAQDLLRAGEGFHRLRLRDGELGEAFQGEHGECLAHDLLGAPVGVGVKVLLQAPGQTRGKVRCGHLQGAEVRVHLSGQGDLGFPGARPAGIQAAS